MNDQDRKLERQLNDVLLRFHQGKHEIPGLKNIESRTVFVRQLIDSIRRIRYVHVISRRDISVDRANPNSDLFDPLKAAILHQRGKNVDEAFWLVFLFVHFGKNNRAGWRYVREVYGRLGAEENWDWVNTSANPAGFRQWLATYQDTLKRQGTTRGFGNHRKYVSLDAYSRDGTDAAVESYVDWVGPSRSHIQLVAQVLERSGGDPRLAFDMLYRSMDAVRSFGRLARFDYLTMIGKLNLAPIEPGSVYMDGATGPVQGARLLFSGSTTGKINKGELNRLLVELDVELKVGMQALEDALCNWQKSPTEYKLFRG